MSMSLSRWIVAASVGALAVGLPHAATAAPILRITTAGNTITVNDNAQGDRDPTPGVIRYDDTLPGFDFVLIRGTSNSPGGPLVSGPIRDAGLLQLQSVQARNATGNRQTLEVVFGDTGFIPAPSNNTLTSSVGLTMTGASQGDTATFQSFYDPTNAAPGTTSPFTTGPQTAVASGQQLTQAYSSTSDMSLPSPTSPNNPFSLSEYVRLDVSPLSQVNLSGTTAAPTLTPEPGTLALAGIGALSLLRRGRRQR